VGYKNIIKSIKYEHEKGKKCLYAESVLTIPHPSHVCIEEKEKEKEKKRRKKKKKKMKMKKEK
jgi:hypothetical protein